MLAERAGIRIAAEYMNFPCRRKPVTRPPRHDHVIEIPTKLPIDPVARRRIGEIGAMR
jgi:hypothetical protein